MIVTWTVLRTLQPQPVVPWQPDGASWWQAGSTGPGRAGPPSDRWWSVLGSRAVGRASGHLASMVQAPEDGAVLTFSAWQDLGSALDWSYAQPQHAGAVARQREHRLVEASGFVRCAVLSSRGTLGDEPDPLAGRTGTVVRGCVAAG